MELLVVETVWCLYSLFASPPDFGSHIWVIINNYTFYLFPSTLVLPFSSRLPTRALENFWISVGCSNHHVPIAVTSDCDPGPQLEQLFQNSTQRSAPVLDNSQWQDMWGGMDPGHLQSFGISPLNECGIWPKIIILEWAFWFLLGVG